MPLVLKGLGRAEDALYAAEYLPAVKGVVVSNHGGRNLDGGPASADVLLQVTGALAAAGRLHREQLAAMQHEHDHGLRTAQEQLNGVKAQQAALRVEMEALVVQAEEAKES